MAAQHGARLLLQFGSTVSGTTHRGSDVDIAVLFDGEPTLDRVAALSHDLAPHFPDRPIDLVVLNHADPLLLKQVTTAACRLAGSARDDANFRAYAFKRYQDHKRFLALERVYIDRVLAARRRA